MDLISRKAVSDLLFKLGCDLKPEDQAVIIVALGMIKGLPSFDPEEPCMGHGEKMGDMASIGMETKTIDEVIKALESARIQVETGNGLWVDYRDNDDLKADALHYLKEYRDAKDDLYEKHKSRSQNGDVD